MACGGMFLQKIPNSKKKFNFIIYIWIFHVISAP